VGADQYGASKAGVTLLTKTMAVEHELHGLASQQPHAIQLPAVQQHLAEAGIVADGRVEAHAPIGYAGRQFPDQAIGRILDQPAVPQGVGLSHARQLLRRRLETGIVHLQERQDAGVHEPVEGHAGDHLHQVPEHVGVDSIVVHFPRLREQREARHFAFQSTTLPLRATRVMAPARFPSWTIWSKRWCNRSRRSGEKPSFAGLERGSG
jgi:hypothetical protein